MESSYEANGKSIDSTVGGLVWVRRRNGSWWPGRILGPDELPESCLVSPRSGTPVKLLGREDASVDWYNLEKSKRVKAFRCGEYDECIEKAKNSSSVSSKKAVKYARREDAILHALEIESSRFPKETPQIQKSDIKDEETEGMSDKLSGLEYISNSPPELEVSPLNDSEDDGIEKSKKRMRGLEDIGIGGAFKRRRSQVAHVHEFLKKKNRRRQLTKVLESTAMVTVPVMCEQLTGSFSMVINNNSDSTTGDVSPTNCKQKENEISCISELLENDSSGRLFDVPFIREEKQNAGFCTMVSEKPQMGAGAQSGQSSLVDTVSIQESGSISSGGGGGGGGGGGVNDIIMNDRMDDKGTSKWQHKGKRNSRNKSKSKNIQNFLGPDVVVGDEANVFSRIDEQVMELHTGPQRLLPYRQSRFTVNPKYESSDVGYRKHDMGSLYDVNIEVKAGHHPHHVPYISLMSKLSGQPIIGHPVVVEVLNESVSDLSLNSSECHSSSCELDGVNGGSPAKSLKNPRRNGFLSSKKIRRLSSLTASKRPSETGKFKKPGQACVPVKVVFGRLNAALGIISLTRSDVGCTR